MRIKPLSTWNSKLNKMRRTFHRYSIRVLKSKKQIRYKLQQYLIYEVRIMSPYGKLDTIYENVKLIDLYKAFQYSLKDNYLDKNIFKGKLRKVPRVRVTKYEPIINKN